MNRKTAVGYEITVADLQAALKTQAMEIRPGDVVLIHTGWGSLWMKDNPKYIAGCPGIGVAANAVWCRSMSVFKNLLI